MIFNQMKLMPKKFTNVNQVLHKVSRMFFTKGALSKLDLNYLCDEENTLEIKENIKRRKGVGDIDKVISLWKCLHKHTYANEQRQLLEEEFCKEAYLIPNKASPHLSSYGESPKLIKTFNEKPTFRFLPKEFHKLAEDLGILRKDHEKIPHLSHFIGQRSFYLTNQLADIEQALVRYSVSHLLKEGFTIISVPDLLYSPIIERCGMQTKGSRSQVYHLKNFGDVCLSGTAEMGLGGYLQDKEFELEKLPLKLAAVSRCFRQETGDVSSEKGIFRVHQFTKVEMFGVTANETGEESENVYKQLINIQIKLFSQLGIHFQVLDMPLHELGAPAYTKMDIEAWIPIQKRYGEISSASNCLDYQSRRLNLRYKDSDANLKFVHTLNGTACAIPRCLIAVVASHQCKDGSVIIPKPLQPYMNEVSSIKPSDKPFNIKNFKQRVYPGTIVNL